MSLPHVGVVMGSESDRDVVAPAGELLSAFGVPWEWRILSAHRTPELAAEYAKSARGRGLRVLLAAAGGAAHLAGTLAAQTTLPVIGLPVRGAAFAGLDALLATVQMPAGVPVATVGVDNARNAALLALAILALGDDDLAHKLETYRDDLARRVKEADRRLHDK